MSGPDEGQTSTWVGEAIGQARGFVEVALSDAERDAVESVLANLDGRRQELVLIGERAFLQLLNRFADGTAAEDLKWLEEAASYEERRAASHASSEAAHQAAEQRRAAMIELRRALLELARDSLQLAIPFLLAALRRGT